MYQWHGHVAPREITSAVLGENVRTTIRDSTPEMAT